MDEVTALTEKFLGKSDAPGEPTSEASSLVTYVRAQLEDMRQYRERIHYVERLGACLRAREGRYDPGTLGKISKFASGHGSTVYARLTTNKIRTAASMMRSIFVQDERPWDILPSPVPTLPDDVKADVETLVQREVASMAEAGQTVPEGAIKQRADQLMQAGEDQARQKAKDESNKGTLYIDDILSEGGFYAALEQFLLDFCTLPVAFMRGPTAVMQKKVKYVNGVPVQVKVPTLTYVRVDPYDVMWSANASDIASADVIERIRMTRFALQQLIGLEGYQEAAVRSAIREYGDTGFTEYNYFDQLREDIQNQDTQLSNAKNIDVLSFSGYVPGRTLAEFKITQGLDKEPIDDDFDYLVQVWLCNRHVLKVQLDPDPRERHGYYAASYEPVPGSVLGTALPELIMDIQDSYNGAWRSLDNNMAIGSGPQVSVNLDRVPDDADVKTMFPWKIWYFNSDQTMSNAEPAVSFFQPDIRSQEIISVLSFLQNLADEVSAIPRYMTGSDKVSGAARTSSGLAMLMGNASRTMTSVAGLIDANILDPVIRKTYDLVLLTTTREQRGGVLKGDESIIVRGATYAEKRETDRMRMLELMQVTANPIDMNIIGPQGRAEMLRSVTGTIMGGENIVPDKATLDANIRQQQAQAAAQAQQAAIAPPQDGGSPAKPKEERTPANAMSEPTDNMQRTRTVQ